MKNLILIGKIEDLFDKTSVAQQNVDDAKFTLVSKDNRRYKMIVHIEHQPYEYHAQAVLKYMEDNKLNELYCHGGGKILFGSTNGIICYGRSKPFNSPDKNHLSKILKSIWPNADELDILTCGKKSKKAKLFSKEEIRKLSLNP